MTEMMQPAEDERSDAPLGLFRRLLRADRPPRSSRQCAHLGDAPTQVTPRTPGRCEDHGPDRDGWVHLRVCLACGHVGCCDSSPQQHARAHYLESGHAVMQSQEPGERWRWCYVDELLG